MRFIPMTSKENRRRNRDEMKSENREELLMAAVLPVLVLQQQLVQLLCLCTAVQVVGLLQNLLCTDRTTQHQVSQRSARVPVHQTHPLSLSLRRPRSRQVLVYRRHRLWGSVYYQSLYLNNASHQGQACQLPFCKAWTTAELCTLW